MVPFPLLTLADPVEENTMSRQRSLGRLGERAAALAAVFALSTTAMAAEPKAGRRNKAQDADATETTQDDARDGSRTRERRKPRSESSQTRELKIAGAVFAGLGVVGLIVGTAGAVSGANKQREADSKQLPEQQDEIERLDSEGARANQMGLAGFVVGGGLLVVGIALLTAGTVIEKRERIAREARVRIAPMGIHRGSGVLLQGRF